MPDIPVPRVGHCTVCNRRSVFVLRNRLTAQLRGRVRCLRCNSRARNRHVALCSARAVGLSSLHEMREQGRHRVLNASSQSPIARQLTGFEQITNTSYSPDIEPGTVRGGVRNEDLTALTFADESFHLVITEDILEHIPDSRAAFREIRRVLRPRGTHVFSIPFHPDRRSRRCFSMVDDDVVLDEPVRFHTDPGRGKIPVFHEFGYDLLDELAEIGFATRLVRSQYRDDRRYGIIDCMTFVSRVSPLG